MKLAGEAGRYVVLKEGPSHPLFGRAFLYYYLPHYAGLGRDAWIPPAEWHDDFDATLFGRLGSGEFHVHLAPRSYGKSTKATLATPLAVLALQLKNYVWLIQDTSSQAKQAMDAILSETESNPRLIRDFPHLRPALGRHSRPVADRDDDVVFSSGARLQALSTGQKLRGRRHRQHRPDLIIIDDAENDELVLTRYQRDKADNWVSSSVLPAASDRADIHMLGTLLHHDSVLARVMKRDGWTSHRYDAFAAGRPTWAFRDLDYHERMRKAMGARAYAREYLHQVTDEESKRFPARWFRYGRPPWNLNEARVRIAVDPAASERTSADYSAVVVVAAMRGEREFYVIDEWHGRVRGKDLRQRVYKMWQLYGGVVVAETVQVQEWLKQELEDEGIPVRGIKPTRDKITRSEPVSLHYENGRVFHAPHLRDSEFELQLDHFPDGEYDDCVDALVYAVTELAHEHGMGSALVIDHSRKKEEVFVDPRYA